MGANVERRRIWALALAVSIALIHVSACVQTPASEPSPAAPHESTPVHSNRTRSANPPPREPDNAPEGIAVDAGPAQRPLVLMTWNIDWFEDPSEGPSDDAAQYAAVRDILLESGADLIALQEVASDAAFERLLSELPDRSGVLSGYDATQKTALLWNDALFELTFAHALKGLDDAGRPPLEVRLRHQPSGQTLLVVVIHAKAHADASSHATRERLAQGLKAHLDAQHATTALIILGDFNDSLVGSITAGVASPYQTLTNDTRYVASTRALDEADARESSYLSGATIDHIVVSDELADHIDPAGANVLRDELLADYPSYAERVSDHFPVTLRLWW